MTNRKPTILMVCAIAIPAITACAPAQYAENATPKLTEKQQKRFNMKLANRVAGEPVSCISQLRRDNEFTVISDDILVYEVGNIVYVNQPYGGCNGAEHNAVINKRTTSQLCSGEILEVRNLQIGATYGSCALGKFTPYRKIDSSAD